MTDPRDGDAHDGSRAVAPSVAHLTTSRTARYYTLGGGAGPGARAPRAVWFVLHGYGQLAGEFVRYFSDLATDDSLVVAPEALNRYYLVSPGAAPAAERPVGATWMTREDRDAEIADYVRYLDALYDAVARAAVDAGGTARVIGFSQGAATATRWTVLGRARLADLVLWGGLVPPDLDLAAAAPRLGASRLALVVGTRDRYIDAAALAAERTRLARARIPHRLVTFDGGHAISRAVFPRLFADAD